MERRGTLLLVDDEDRLRSLIARFLRAEGYLIVEAGDGGAAVERHADSGPFDLALVDLNLPILGGVEVCRRIRAARPDQAILICTAALDVEHQRSLADLGLADVLTKPYMPETLLNRVRTWVGSATTTIATASAAAGKPRSDGNTRAA